MSISGRVKLVAAAAMFVWSRPSVAPAQQKPPQPLPPVTVAEKKTPTLEEAKYRDFFHRRKLGQGTFRSRADFEKMGAPDIASALRGIPGVNVTGTHNMNGEPELRMRLARCPGQPPNLALYVNGHRQAVFGKHSANKGSELSGLFRPRRADSSSTCDDCARLGALLAAIPLMEVQHLEFYRGPGQIPAELDRGDACAALVLWTR